MNILFFSFSLSSLFFRFIVLFSKFKQVGREKEVHINNKILGILLFLHKLYTLSFYINQTTNIMSFTLLINYERHYTSCKLIIKN